LKRQSWKKTTKIFNLEEICKMHSQQISSKTFSKYVWKHCHDAALELHELTKLQKHQLIVSLGMLVLISIFRNSTNTK